MVKSSQDFGAGVLFLGFGIFLFWLNRGHAIGAASRMGPGFFPMIVAGGLCVIGLIVMGRAFVIRGADLSRIAARPFLVLGAVVAYGLLLKPAGFVIATLVLTVGSGLAGKEFKVGDIVRLALVLLPFTWIVFGWGLAVPLPAWPSW